MKVKIGASLRLMTLLAVVMVVSACVASDGSVHVKMADSVRPSEMKQHNLPFAHAPAYGRRVKHRYRYYPASSVYFDTDRKVYFYLSGDKGQRSGSLPERLKLLLGTHVEMKFETEEPFQEYECHKVKYKKSKNKRKGRTTIMKTKATVVTGRIVATGTKLPNCGLS